MSINLSCVSQLSGYPLSARLLHGYDSAIDNLKFIQGGSEETRYTSYYTFVLLYVLVWVLSCCQLD